MKLGTALFLCFIVYAIFYLYKNHTQGFIKTLKAVLFIAIAGSIGTWLYTSYTEHKDRQKEIKQQNIENRNAEERRQAEQAEAAKRKKSAQERECVATNITQIESLIKEVYGVIYSKKDDEDALDKIKVDVDKLLKINSDLYHSYGNIKERILQIIMKTECGEDFRVVFTITSLPTGKVKKISAYPIGEPAGYSLLKEIPYLNQDFEPKPIVKAAPRLLDHCEPGISSAERLRRLKKRGVVRQDGATYQTKNHKFTVYGAINDWDRDNKAWGCE